MKGTRLLLILFMCLSLSVNAQSDSVKGWSGESNFLMTVYRLGSYVKERPTFFLEQNFNYRFHDHFSAGAGLGINAYPGLLGFPVGVHGKYHFAIKSMNFSVLQSYHRYLNLGDLFFKSNRYLGELVGHVELNKIELTPRIGYNYLFDKYDGRNLGFLLGIGVSYKIGN
ncbi:MAG: hypothetical protein AB8B72_01335 [Crocinitomicaceae bacterium]